MLQKSELNLNKELFWVGGFHGIALLYGLFETISKVVKEERGVTNNDVFLICVHLFIHILLIFTLVLGVVTKKAIFFVPWLIVSFPIFVSLSYYTVIYSRLTYPSQFIINLCFIVMLWYMWYIVYRCCNKTKQIRQKF